MGSMKKNLPVDDDKFLPVHLFHHVPDQLENNKISNIASTAMWQERYAICITELRKMHIV